MANILVVYYSSYGHIHEMALAASEGVQQVEGTEVKVVKVPEFEVTKKQMSQQDAYVKAQEAQADIPEVTLDDLKWADGIIWGIPTRYGMMPAQIKQLLDSAGGLWANGELEGKATAVITSSNTIHGGQESTAITTFVPLMHFGMIYVGVPYGENSEMMTDEGIGGSPYAASTVAGADGSRQPVDAEKTMASRLGVRVAKVAKALKGNL
ncbi:NAD(P)H:quinone oxidoreductase [Fictibacillus phosphorivorans]|uniref:NAD(P)H:quinone oxidoreductase n=1 Tax=Fictibacillus phosphorivorans TaxID=1221500 RepID=UPI0020413BF1|nr:NAD(P)H:quinone oxidoreductase [Fictibacillus phosphorivorans]MCM3717397.1 NAD(P)H:quinone oxidoreductase [Fictibacillus phosphorivorans]MCM3775092.1 NAD(P)H:quinone oxidoreductase [Fictibacillus phosphorivorans]